MEVSTKTFFNDNLLVYQETDSHHSMATALNIMILQLITLERTHSGQGEEVPHLSPPP